MFDPILVAIDLAPDRLRVDLGDRPGDGPWARNGSVVDRVHRGDLGRGAADEDLFGDIEVAACEIADDDLVAEVAADGRDTRLRDAFERARRQRWRDDAAVAHAEDVLAGALADETLRVQHDGLVVASLERLDLGQRRVDVVAGRLRRGRHGVVVVTRPRTDLHADTLFDGVVAEVRAPR